MTRGFINQRNKSLITHLCNTMRVKKVGHVTKMCSKLAVLGSYTIWNARYSADWSGGGYLAAWGLENNYLHPHPTTSFWYPATSALWGLARTPSTFPVLVLCSPWQKGLEPRCGLTPPPPSSFTHHLSIIFKCRTAEADALPLFWEFYSGGGVICGASMHYDWNSFYLFAHFIGSFALLPINCTLSLLQYSVKFQESSAPPGEGFACSKVVKPLQFNLYVKVFMCLAN